MSNRQVRLMGDTLTLKPLLEVFPNIEKSTVLVLDRFYYRRNCIPSKSAVDEIIDRCEKGTK